MASEAAALEHGVDLRPYNTFGLPGRARALLRVRSAEQLADLASEDGGAVMVLGGGSNIVVGGDVDALVLKIEIPGRRLVEETDDAWYVEAGAGEPWHDFVRWTLGMGWGGLENLSLIPGTVGAAPIQNIGAYGLELAERFHHLDAVDLRSGERRRFQHRECAFGYRDSVFKQAEAGRWAIVAVTFRLSRPWQPVTRYAELARELEARRVQASSDVAFPEAMAVSDAVIAIRRRKLPDPAQIGNAGSFFKNPVVDAATAARLQAAHPDMPCYPQADGTTKLAAGWLIEQSGWKGRDLGPVGCFERQALVLVNRGGARGSDVRRIADAIQADVRARFGIALEPEPVFV